MIGCVRETQEQCFRQKWVNEMQQKETKQTKRIKQISVTKLFGMFNHVIPLNLEDRITIVHGPNGFGKTVMLRLVKSLFSQNNTMLLKTPFSEFRVDFDDNTSLWMVKTSEAEGEDHSTTQLLTFYATDYPPFRLPLNPPSYLSTIQPNIAESHIVFDRISDEWRRRLTESVEGITIRYGDRLREEITLGKQPEWLTELRRAVDTRLIETQRLLNPIKSSRQSEYETQSSMEHAVTAYSKDLVDIIKTKLAESTALSQSLDSTFPARLVSPTARQHSTTEKELRDKLSMLEKERTRLMAAGLLDQDATPAFKVGDQIDESTKVVLAVYTEDTERKLGVFQELANKIELLTRIINRHFLYKKMTISREKGFVFTTRDGTNVLYTDLSSGEQHELILFYELLFKAASDSLILIDEPEISLHVVWQEEFLKDLQEATRLSGIDVLIATHSPDIISDRRDLMVELKGPSNGRV